MNCLVETFYFLYQMLLLYCYILLLNCCIADGYDLDSVLVRMAKNCLSVDEVKRLLKPTFSKAQCQALFRVIKWIHPQILVGHH